MPTLEIIITFFIFLFSLSPNQTSATCHETRCKAKEQWVRFPFQLIREGQDLACGYDRGFDLSCSNHHKRTILTLPSSGDFIVKDINYIDHIIWIDDTESCFPKRLMDHNFSLVGSPFSYFYGLESYLFLNCPSGEDILAPSSPIDCLSSDEYKVFAVQSTWFYAGLNTSSVSSRPLAQTSLSRLCSVISTALIPLSGSFDGWDLKYGVRLAWNLPDCRLCEASGRLCGLDIATGSQDVCSGPSNSVHHGNSSGETLSTAMYVIGGGILVLLFVCVLPMCCSSNPPSDEPTTLTTGWSGVTNHQQPPLALDPELNCVTTEAYPKTQLGDESLELPNPNDKTCAICLCDYQPKETIKTIPLCNHYFHLTCIDEWFRKNVTCPLCRTQSNNEGLGFSRQPLQDMSVLSL